MIKKVSIILTSFFLIVLSYQIYNDDINQLPEDGKTNSYLINEELVEKKDDYTEKGNKPEEKSISKEIVKKKYNIKEE